MVQVRHYTGLASAAAVAAVVAPAPPPAHLPAEPSSSPSAATLLVPSSTAMTYHGVAAGDDARREPTSPLRLGTGPVANLRAASPEARH